MTCIAFIDTETVSVTAGPATIWELAVVLRDRRVYEADTEYLWQIRPDLASADPQALRVGGFYERCRVPHQAQGEVQQMPCATGEFPGEKPSPTGRRVLAGQLAQMLDGAHLIAANPAFDAGHLEAFVRASDYCPAWDYHLTDIGSVVRGWAAARGELLPFPLKVHQAAEAAGIDPARYEAHTALGDARLVRDIFDKVTSRCARPPASSA